MNTLQQPESKHTSNLKDKPLICLIDLPPQLLEHLTTGSFNCTTGSFGSYIMNPNIQRKETTLVSLNHSFPENLHEHDILVIDMGAKPAVDYDSQSMRFESTLSNNKLALQSAYPETRFNPRPYATNILKDTISKILRKESILIIFADKIEQVSYQHVEIETYKNTLKHAATYSNSMFFKEFPTGTNEFGKQFKTVTNDSPITPTLLKYLDQAHYEVTFNHPRFYNGKEHVNSSNFIPLLTNNENRVVSFEYTWDKGIVLVFPQLSNKNDFLLTLFTNVLPELSPTIFPYHGNFGWLNDASYPMPGEIELIQKKELIEQAYKEDIRTNTENLANLKVEYNFLRQLLSETGEELVRAIETYFKWLEFESVVNLDDSNPEILEEDLQVDLGDKFLVIEIKGIGGTSTDKDCSQISKIKYRRAEERGKFDVYALYIVNHQRYQPPKSRRNPPFTENQINDAVLDKRGLLTTYSLFKAYFLVQQGILKKEDIRNQLLQTGLIEFTPGNLVSLGIPTEFFLDGKVVILNINDISITKGEQIIVKKKGQYTTREITSIEVDDQEVETITSGEVGIKVNTKIKKNSELFVFKN